MDNDEYIQKYAMKDVCNNITHVLLLGGTGAMGANLVDLLSHQQGVHVVVTSRRDRKSFDNVEYRCGDAHDTTWLQEILEENKWDAIVDFMVYTTEEFSNRIDLLLESTKQYIFISSSRVYADAKGKLITEESPRLLDVCSDKRYLQTDDYALTKARQEDMLLHHQRKNWTIIRPYLTFSKNRLQLGVMEKEHWLIPALNKRTIVFSKDIAQHYTTMTDGKVVAKCITAILFRTEAYGEIFHVASSETHRWSEILTWYIDAVREVKGYKPDVYLTDQWNSTFGGGEYEFLYDRLFDRHFDNSKICRFISKEEFTSMEDSLKNAVKAFAISYQPNYRDLDQNIEYTRGRLTKNFLPLKQITGMKRKVKVLAHNLRVYSLL